MTTNLNKRVGTVLLVFAIILSYLNFIDRDITGTVSTIIQESYTNFMYPKEKVLKTSCIWQTEDEPLKPIELPSCIQRWHDASKARVQMETLSFNKQYKETNQSQHCEAGHMQGIHEPGDPFHQPWWGGLYFYYVSMMLWQDFIFESKSCIRYLMVDEEASTLWTAILADDPSWTVQTVHLLKPVMGPFVVSTNCASTKHNVKALNVEKFTEANMNRSGWFIDGSDAYWLGSVLSKETDPCGSVQGQSRALIHKSTLQFTLGQRKWARKFTNVPEMQSTIRSFQSSPAAHNTTFNVSVIDFEGMSLIQQIKLMRSTDVMISVHGAGLTNIAFMKPCSIIIEVMPFGLDIPRSDLYFKKLASSVDVLHYFWTADKQDTTLMPGAIVAGGKDCASRYNVISSDPDQGYHQCYFDKYCRACAKLTAVSAQPSLIDKNLEHALIDRKQCLRNHPLYAAAGIGGETSNTKTSSALGVENTKENSNSVKTISMNENNHPPHNHDGSAKRIRKSGRLGLGVKSAQGQELE